VTNKSGGDAVKRIAISLGVVVTTVVLGASTALAQYPPTNTPDPDAPAGGSLPFTGANISWGLVLVVALVVTGAVLLFTGRRRSRTQ